jgi:hypothetical protein
LPQPWVEPTQQPGSSQVLSQSSSLPLQVSDGGTQLPQSHEELQVWVPVLTETGSHVV